MKYMWRITKYNPLNCDENGLYVKDEWTSFSDIGDFYNDLEFTMPEYLKYEKAYIDSILTLMECNNIHSLNIIGLEKRDDDKFTNTLKEGMSLSKQQIEEVVKQILREKIWCKLIKDDSFYVHFGYDFYMYIGANYKCNSAINYIKDNNMFIESFVSPYLD